MWNVLKYNRNWWRDWWCDSEIVKDQVKRADVIWDYSQHKTRNEPFLFFTSFSALASKYSAAIRFSGTTKAGSFCWRPWGTEEKERERVRGAEGWEQERGEGERIGGVRRREVYSNIGWSLWNYLVTSRNMSVFNVQACGSEDEAAWLIWVRIRRCFCNMAEGCCGWSHSS